MNDGRIVPMNRVVLPTSGDGVGATPRPGAPARFADAWSIALALVTICSLLSLAGDAGRDHLALDRMAVVRGELWRWATGHVVHLDAAHAALDGGGLVLVALVFGRELGARAQALALGCGLVAIDTALWVLHPEVTRYVGLSGLLHAWFAAGATAWLVGPPSDARRRAWGALLVVALAAKLALEARGHAPWSAALQGLVVTAAHRWGAAGGVVAGLLVAHARRRAQASRRERHDREEPQG